MCRNIRPLFNYDPPTTDTEIRDAALQFVRKVSGYHDPSEANRAVFDAAVDRITAEIHTLLDGLVTTAPKRDRAAEIARKREEAKRRFGV
jgi:hypothetical protein